ncbi:hypothetical protein B6S59_01235 [Pseudomonas sp. A46]|nr:Zn-dependent hydrolase [Pseudomonas sp. A46]OWJ98229.1 hypothetical protein B6S59_01235 [Pseudomonas sp. A46]
MNRPVINGERMLSRLEQLGRIGGLSAGGCTRLALTDEDKAGRDQIVTWLREAGATIYIDQIGNIYGVVEGTAPGRPVMTGSHIDTVSRAGNLDGCYGVIAGIEMLQSIKDAGLQPRYSLGVTVFSNEEGVRFSPDLLGSRVIAKDISLDEALAALSKDGKDFGEELKRIGYRGDLSPWELIPQKFVELHIEQGPQLEASGVQIGVVEAVQGHSWWQVVVEGCANHAGTTPMTLRKDAGAAAMELACALQSSALQGLPDVATVGTFSLEPNAINVVPGRARFTVDFRDAENAKLRKADALLLFHAKKLEENGFTVNLTSLSRSLSVSFDYGLCDVIEREAERFGATTMRMVSGASHDAQMIATLCPTAMLFVQSISGISHNPREKTPDTDLVMGAQILTETLWSLSTAG